jgi:methyl-accepting chemotaxis protein
MKTTRPRWRRKYFVHPIQRKYFFLSLVPVIACTFLLIVGFFVPLRLMLSQLQLEADPGLFVERMYGLALRIWPLVLLSLLVSGLASFMVTNRFAGPIFRFMRILEGVAAGRLPQGPVRVRRGDDFQDLAGQLDSALSLIRNALAEIRDHMQRANREVAALEGRVKTTPHSTPEIIERLEAIARYHRDVTGVLDRFTLQTPVESPQSDPQADRKQRPVPAD